MSDRIERTSEGLREELFLTLERLRDKEIDPIEAKTVAAVAAQIVNTVNLEINAQRLRMEYPEGAKVAVPAPLKLGPAQV